MSASSDLRSHHRFDSAEKKKTAERRVHELSKPGAPMTMTAYINKLIEADGKKHPVRRRA